MPPVHRRGTDRYFKRNHGIGFWTPSRYDRDWTPSRYWSYHFYSECPESEGISSTIRVV